MSHNKLGSPNLRGSLRGRQRVHVSECVCVARGSAGVAGRLSLGRGRCPASFPGPRRVAHTGPLSAGHWPNASHPGETLHRGFPAGSVVKNPPCQCRRRRPLPGPEDPTRLGATKLHTPKDKACAPELGAASLRPPGPGAPAPQQERPRTPGSQGRAQAAETQNGQSKQIQPCSKRSAAQTRPGKGPATQGSRRPGRRTRETNRREPWK